MSSQHSISQLQTQFDVLQQQIKQSKLSQQNWFRSSDIFNSSAFHTQSDEIDDYLSELKKNINRLVGVTEQSHADFLAETITRQFNCFKNLLGSINLSQKYLSQSHRKPNLTQRVKQIAQQVTKSSQSLYQELSKLHEYERRLQEMVLDKQAALNNYRGNNAAELQQQVLITQQRLGRCRQAITKVEEDIQKLDSRP